MTDVDLKEEIRICVHEMNQLLDEVSQIDYTIADLNARKLACGVEFNELLKRVELYRELDKVMSKINSVSVYC